MFTFFSQIKGLGLNSRKLSKINVVMGLIQQLDTVSTLIIDTYYVCSDDECQNFDSSVQILRCDTHTKLPLNDVYRTIYETFTEHSLRIRRPMTTL